MDVPSHSSLEKKGCPLTLIDSPINGQRQQHGIQGSQQSHNFYVPSELKLLTIYFIHYLLKKTERTTRELYCPSLNLT